MTDSVLGEVRADVRLENIHKSFRGGRDKVLRGVNLEFPAGKLTYILGSSGAGKSVILKHVLGLLKPDRGSVWVAGKNISSMTPRELSQHRTVFGMLFQNSALFDDMTIFDNVAFPLREHTAMSETEIARKVKEALSHLGIVAGLDKLPSELSGGMRKRVGLARAIIREPKILLYDEPTTGLDPVTRTTVDELIETLKRELALTSIVISHDIPSALLLADQIAFLHQGEIVFWGKPEEFRVARHEAIQAFLSAEKRSVDAFRGVRWEQ
ncbi:MAG: ATP-binding cassette domain-containing protein [Oligoflexia bacterium]|nr:ATP-binding cassette domain-containing protein [Oligoflexia bacterium]